MRKETSKPHTVSPFSKIRPLDPSAVQWTAGFWSDHFQRCRDTTLDSIRAALEHPDNAATLRNFRVAAGHEEAPFQGHPWSDGDCYKWMEAMAWVYWVTKDAELGSELDELIELIAAAQDDDGYLNTQIQTTGKARWIRRFEHEDYNLGHLFTAACVHHHATGKRNFLEIALKAADCTYERFIHEGDAAATFGWNPVHMVGLVDLYRTTGDTKYLKLNSLFIDRRGTTSVPYPSAWDHCPGDQNQMRTPLREETEALGHAVTAIYLYCGAADMYLGGRHLPKDVHHRRHRSSIPRPNPQQGWRTRSLRLGVHPPARPRLQ